MNGSDKLTNLRKKTDKQLVQLIDNELDDCIRAARQVSKFSNAWTDSVEETYSTAKRNHGEASRLMEFFEVRDSKGNELEVRLEHLGQILNVLAPSQGEMRLCVI